MQRSGGRDSVDDSVFFVRAKQSYSYSSSYSSNDNYGSDSTNEGSSYQSGSNSRGQDQYYSNNNDQTVTYYGGNQGDYSYTSQQPQNQTQPQPQSQSQYSSYSQSQPQNQQAQSQPQYSSFSQSQSSSQSSSNNQQSRKPGTLGKFGSLIIVLEYSENPNGSSSSSSNASSSRIPRGSNSAGQSSWRQDTFEPSNNDQCPLEYIVEGFKEIARTDVEVSTTVKKPVVTYVEEEECKTITIPTFKKEFNMFRVAPVKIQQRTSQNNGYYQESEKCETCESEYIYSKPIL